MSFLPATAWGVPDEYTHLVAHILAHAGLREFDVAVDEQKNVPFFCFENEHEMEVSADIIYDEFAPQFSAGKGKWIGWQCRPQRQGGVPHWTNKRVLS